jgi:hypothetical protein
LQEGNRIIIQTTQCIWVLTVRDPAKGLVEVYGSDLRFIEGKPLMGELTEAVEPIQNGRCLKLYLVKGWKFLLTFANVVVVCNPVVTARVEGDGWHYEAIE